MGTPEFAVASLKAIQNSGIHIKGVITAPDKPAGRGKKLTSSAVKQFAVAHQIDPILQPTNLKDPEFQEELKSLSADLFVVVAFRMLPESVWDMPPRGTVNLHASLLPDYRGAAPINWAIINGEKKTGVTTFFIEKEIDTGKIIRSENVNIEQDDTAGSLHDKLMDLGAKVLVETIHNIQDGCYEAVSQDVLVKHKPKVAPKIFKEDCKIDWHQPVEKIYNLIRGLSPYPAAWTEFLAPATSEKLGFKIFDAEMEESVPAGNPGTIVFGDDWLKICCTNGFLKVTVLQQAGKKRMNTASFLRGFKETDKYTLAT
jgi:methionyl-tRNA formyltransferase